MKLTLRRLLFAAAFAATFASGWLSHASQAVQAMNEADARLNVLYKKLLAAVPSAAQKEKLKTAQRAWLAWVEAEAKFQSSLLLDGKAELFARLDQTEARNKQLEELLSRGDEYQR